MAEEIKKLEEIKQEPPKTVTISEEEYKKLKTNNNNAFLNNLDILEIMDDSLGASLNHVIYLFNNREKIKNIMKGNNR